jgi:hypothetical protein
MENVRTVSTAAMTKAERLRQRLYVEARQEGVNPTQMLELLEMVTQERIWEELGISLLELIEAPYPKGIGLTRDDLLTIIKLHHKYERDDLEILAHMANMREVVIRELNPELLSAGPLSKEEKDKGYNVTFMPTEDNERGNNAEYTLRRLRRDNPELAEKVIKGELSANKAAIKAGFRKPTVTVPIDPTRAAQTLIRNFHKEQLEEMLSIIAQHLIGD